MSSAATALSKNAFSAAYGSDEVSITRHVNSLVQNYSKHQDQLAIFLASFEEDKKIQDELREHFTGIHGRKKYLNQLQQIVNQKSTCLKIWVADLVEFFRETPDDENLYNEADYNQANLNRGDRSRSGFERGRKGKEKLDSTLPHCVITNCMRYIQLFYEAAELVRKTYVVATEDSYINNSNSNSNSNSYSSSSSSTATTNVGDDSDLRTSEFERGMGRIDKMEKGKVPVHLRVSYEIRLVPIPTDDHLLSVRDVRSKHIGMLVQMEGVVTRVSTVKPRLQIAYYRCQDCGCDAYQPIEGFSYMPLLFCQSDACRSNQRKGDLRLELVESKFIKYQEVKVQEPTYRVPAGSIPRTQRLIVEGSLTRRLLPGMLVVLSGVLLPVPKSGYFAIKSSLVTATKFHVQDIAIQKRTYGVGDLSDCTPEEALRVKRIVEHYENDPALYEKMARSIGPSIHGLEDVKKTLLLQLVGGVNEMFVDGMKLRGDIHVLLMGDPGVAKSQLLGQICKIAPRAHYTTGKGSSGVGLTASVVRDGITGDFTLEGGAIVLSDRGICSIDEFDKMDEYDRTAIHEVMEQQTVSISKAGLTTTLNARTSVLAAANPQYGRYDVRRSPMQNINLPAALLSRFDVQFLLLDKADRDADYKLALHILKIHQSAASAAMAASGSASAASEISAAASADGGGGRRHSAMMTEGVGCETNIDGEEVLDTNALRVLIGKAKTYNPKIPSHLVKEVVEYYVDLRQQEKSDRGRNSDAVTTYTTPRTLFAVLRLAQACARLRFSSVIDRGDVEEGLRLITESKRSLWDALEANQRQKKRDDYQSDVLDILRDLDLKQSKSENWDGWISMIEAETHSGRLGFTKEQLKSTIDAYVELAVLKWRSETQRDVGFVSRFPLG